MKNKEYAKRYNPIELMCILASKELKDGEVAFIGIGLQLISAMLAKATHAPNLRLVFESGYIGGQPCGVVTSIADNMLGRKALVHTSTWRVFSDLQNSLFDLGMIGGAQIDKYGNVNSTAIFGEGDYYKPYRRLPGSGGASDIASHSRKLVILMQLQRRRFAPRVDHLTSLGYGEGPDTREKFSIPGGGPVLCITDKALFRFDKDTKEMYLDSVYPGVNVEDVKKEVQWNLKVPSQVKVVEPPTTEEISLLHEIDPTRLVLERRLLTETMDFNTYINTIKPCWIKFIEREKL